MRSVITMFLLFCSSPVFAGAQSVSSGTVSLIQVKNETAEVPATIAGMTGSVDLEAGTGTLTIPVNAWDSQLEIRDLNVRNAFFNAETHPTATFTLESLALAEGAGTAKGTLSLFAGSVPVEASVKTSTGEAGTTIVETTEPFVVSIAGLGMAEPLAAVMKLCGHQSVSDAVKVSIKLELAAE